jgi:hypothetical protein
MNSKFNDSVEFVLGITLKFDPLFVEFIFVLGIIFVFVFEFVSGI